MNKFRVSANVLILAFFPMLVLAAGPADKQLDLPSFGMSIPIPAGYTRMIERTPWVACRFEVLDKAGNSQQLITVQIAKLPAGQTSEQMAKGMDKKGSPLRIKWGGVDAFDVRGDPQEAKNNWYAARHVLVDGDGYSFMLSYATVPGKEDFKLIDEIVSKTIWTKRKTVAESVKPRGHVVGLEGGIEADLPDPFRKDANTSRPGQELFVATDFATGKSGMKLVHMATRGDVGATLDKVIDDFTKQTGKPLTWRKTQNGKVAISSLFDMPGQGDFQAVATIVQGNMHILVINTLQEAGDLKRAHEAAEIVAQSLAPAK